MKNPTPVKSVEYMTVAEEALVSLTGTVTVSIMRATAAAKGIAHLSPTKAGRELGLYTLSDCYLFVFHSWTIVLDHQRPYLTKGSTVQHNS
jgi:hypothetical protein